jgi:hypothetical protein
MGLHTLEGREGKSLDGEKEEELYNLSQPELD